MLAINNVEVVYDNIILVLKATVAQRQAEDDHDTAWRQWRRQATTLKAIYRASSTPSAVR